MTGRRDRDHRQQVDALKEALDVYISGRSGIRFDALMRFAGPLFDLYDVDWRTDDGISALSRDRQELSTMVAVLDAARLLWAFFALDDEANLEGLPELEDALLGTSAGDEERSNLLVLLSLLEEHWQSFSPEERAQAEDTPGYTLPPFDTLLANFADTVRRLPRGTRKTYGPERLDLPEALAVFAEPLLEDEDVRHNPDLIEERIARAQAYWDLANTPEDLYEEELARIENSFAGPSADPSDIRLEAERMVSRYHELFSTAEDDEPSP